MAKFVYAFGGGKADGKASMKELLGGWEIDRLCQQRPVWVPGSVFGTNGGKQWLIDNYGFWVSSQA